MNPFVYILPIALNRKKIEKILPTPPYQISFAEDEKRQGVLLDTFAGEMFQSAKMLYQVGEMLFLIDLHSGRLSEQVASEEWSFAGDLPAGPVSSPLQQVSALRAFLPIAKVELCVEHGILLDDEGKTRARLNSITIRHGRKSVGVGSTQYLRGYGQAHADLCRSLEKIGAVACLDVGQVYGYLGIKQEKYNAKPVVPLDPDAPVKAGTGVIITTFIQIARHNEKGVVADYDTEFLHDYRVSLRKVRSVLSLFKGVYDLEETAQLKKDFSSLMQKTNTLRDLDVYLLNKEKYFKLVPVDTHEGLDILFRYFSGKRKKEQKIVSTVLRSKSYLKEINRLKKLFADGLAIASGPKGQERCLDFACGLVLKRYGKVCKIARSIDGETKDDVIHQLRIQCKKLRYLMEFFSPIFPESEIKTLIKSLKVLQDNLGNFNDYSVQQKFLRHVLDEEMTSFGGHKLKVAESVGALTAMLHRLQMKERRQVVRNFAHFDNLETRMTFTKLFDSKEIVDENNSLLQ